jgi:glutathione-independent formaldehyde dehydrogenase
MRCELRSNGRGVETRRARRTSKRASKRKGDETMSSNRGVVYLGQGKVDVQSIDYPKMVDPSGRAIGHGVILKVVSTNICGSDQHMVRGRTTAEIGLVLGHEITGEVIEVGRDVETLKVGDLVSVPFNAARCARSSTQACA